MLNINHPIVVALHKQATSIDKKLDGAYYALQVARAEQSVDLQACREFYRELYAQSLDAWATYWRIQGHFCVR